MNSSAQTVVRGVTVLEPITLNEPDSSDPVGACEGVVWAQPVMANASASIATDDMMFNRFINLDFKYFSPLISFNNVNTYFL
jgi:hypothetical protein